MPGMKLFTLRPARWSRLLGVGAAITVASMVVSGCGQDWHTMTGWTAGGGSSTAQDPGCKLSVDEPAISVGSSTYTVKASGQLTCPSAVVTQSMTIELWAKNVGSDPFTRVAVEDVAAESGGRQQKKSTTATFPNTSQGKVFKARIIGHALRYGSIHESDPDIFLTYYPTSWKYGGSDRSVNVTAEIRSLAAALNDAGETERDTIWAGLSPVDQVRFVQADDIGGYAGDSDDSEPELESDMGYFGLGDPNESEAGEPSPRSSTEDPDEPIGGCGTKRVTYLRVAKAPATTMMLLERTAVGRDPDNKKFYRYNVEARTLGPWEDIATWAGVAWETDKRVLKERKSNGQVTYYNAKFPMQNSTKRDESRATKQPWYFHATATLYQGHPLWFRGKARHEKFSVRFEGHIVSTWGASYPHRNKAMFRCTT